MIEVPDSREKCMATKVEPKETIAEFIHDAAQLLSHAEEEYAGIHGYLEELRDDLQRLEDNYPPKDATQDELDEYEMNVEGVIDWAESILEMNHGADATFKNLSERYENIAEAVVKTFKKASKRDVDMRVKIVRDGKVDGYLDAQAFMREVGVSRNSFLHDAVEKFNRQNRDVQAEIVPVFKKASTSRYCGFYLATDGYWYMDLAPHEHGDYHDADTYGPFGSLDRALEYLDEFSNPGGYGVDDSGTKPAPKRSPNGRPVRRAR